MEAPLALSSLPADAAVRARVAVLAARHGLDLVVLFGSVARGQVHAHSDVDLAVRCIRRCVDAPLWLKLSSELPAALGVSDVDLVDLRTADPLLLRQIFDRAIPLFEEPGAFAAARLYAFHRYEDYRPYLRLERKVVRAMLGFHDVAAKSDDALLADHTVFKGRGPSDVAEKHDAYLYEVTDCDLKRP